MPSFEALKVEGARLRESVAALWAKEEAAFDAFVAKPTDQNARALEHALDKYRAKGTAFQANLLAQIDELKALRGNQ